MNTNMIVSSGFVNRAQNTIFSYQAWPSICRDENGTLYAVASGMRVAHICPFGKTVMYISKNDGKTWSPPIVINDDYMDDRDAGILYMGGGRMLVTWFSHPPVAYKTTWRELITQLVAPQEHEAVFAMIETSLHAPQEYLHGGSFIRISEDYGVTWGEAIRVPVSAPHGPVLCADGSLLYLGKEMYVPGRPADADNHICAYKSTDGGYHWQHMGTVPLPTGTYSRNFHEPHAVQLSDGRLLGLIRAEGPEISDCFTVFKTLSADGGATWSTAAPTGFDGSPPHLLRHSTGALVCAYGRRRDAYSIRAVISHDDGDTWSDEIILEDRVNGNDLGYPASVELADGSLLTVYYQKWPGDEKCSIRYTRWNIPKEG